jgi:hypothetical protein
MNNLKVTTGNPQSLKDDINDKIINNEIRTWEIDNTGNYLSHKGDQYRNHFYFKYKIV